MKHIYIITIFFSFTSVSFSQQIISSNYTSDYNSARGTNNTTFTMNYDFNNDGNAEVFKGTMLKIISPDVYWVKNSQILTPDNKVLVDLNRKLLVNNISIIDQVQAYYGYIVEFVKNKGNNEIIIAIANSKGEKDSDDLVINLDDIK
jgi:hypothetical protein